MIRSWIKAGTANLFYKTGIDRVLRPPNVPVVVGYHRVVEDFGFSATTSIPSLLISRRMLERHLDWIGRRHRFVDLNELGARLESGIGLNDRIAAITFDDGYQDFYDHALPVLWKKGIPAAIFVVTEHLGTMRVPVHDKLYLLLTRRHGRPPLKQCSGLRVPDIFGMDPYQAVRTLLEALPLDALHQLIQTLGAEDPLDDDLFKPFHSLSWETVGRIHRAGITVGSHTRSHVLMTNESKERVLDEALGSRQDIERRLKSKVQHFAYPSGVFNATSVKAVAAAGYRFGYTTCTHRSAARPLLTVPRTLLWEYSSLNSQSTFSGPVLNCQIHNAFRWADPCYQHHARMQGN
jgi:peptidoglycan/xylan/chitin deacetylase (PgdA/CDA1 family)